MDQRRIVDALVAAGLACEGEAPRFTSLGGGVSCDVFRVDLASGPLCVKQALPKLRVAADWTVSPDRAHAEAEWLRQAPALGIAAPRLIHEDRAEHLLVMEFLPPDAHPVWKDRLMAGGSAPAFAAVVGAAMARMHRGSWRSEILAARFANGALFEALRIDPFLNAVAQAHPDRAEAILDVAQRTRATREALVHGDFSPKNILCGRHGPVLLDAECADFGDPAFDLAFCLSHLLLKTLHVDGAILADAHALHAAYRDAMGRFAPPILARAAPLLAVLLLARVDGKSPASYLRADEQRHVRAVARRWLIAADLDISDMIDTVKEKA